MDKKTAAQLRERDARLARLAKRHPAAAADVINALARVRYFRGEADEQFCAGPGCNKRAEEWQLVELSRREGPRFLLYSEEPEHYAPFCSLCALDAEEARWKKLTAQ